MPVVEAPFWDQFPGFEGTFAPEGAFVLVKIDPVASVAVLDDEETTRAAAALDGHEWVLGVITGCRGGGFFDPMNKPLMSLQIELCGQGPPDDKPIASIPISPSPQLYDDRPPVQLHSPLPWPNVYFHTNFCSSVIISRIHHGAVSFEPSLTKEQYDDLSRRAFRDRYNWHKLPPETVPEPTDVILVDPDKPEKLSDYATEDSSDDGRDSLYAQDMEDMGFKIARQRIYGEICLDPSMCPGALGAPAQMREPVASIRDLWSEWEERRTTAIYARQPETTAWAQGVADAHSNQSEPEIVDPEVTPPVDDMIMPEDAIDDQVDRERLLRAARPPDSSPQTDLVASLAPIAVSPSTGLTGPALALNTSSVVNEASGTKVRTNDLGATGIAEGHAITVAVDSVPLGSPTTSPAPDTGPRMADGHDRVPASGVPALGIKFAGLMKRLRSVFLGFIASVKRSFAPAQKEPSDNGASRPGT